jgi:hypothetical protein
MFQIPYFVKVAVDLTGAAGEGATEIEVVAPGRGVLYPNFEFDAVAHMVTDETELIGIPCLSCSQTHLTAPVTQKCLIQTTQDLCELSRGINDAVLLVVNC